MPTETLFDAKLEVNVPKGHDPYKQTLWALRKQNMFRIAKKIEKAGPAWRETAAVLGVVVK